MASGIKEARKITAILLTLIMISASVSIPAFADSSDGVTEIARLKQAMEDAGQTADRAKEKMDQAEKEMNSLKSDWEDKKNEADRAAKDEEAAKSALENAKKDRDDAFESRKTQAAQALSAAQTVYDNAVSAFEAAKKVVTDKEGSLADAQNRKAGLETDIQTLTSEKETAQNTIDSLPSQIAQAESTLESANSRWEQEKQAAADAVSAAQANCDSAGKEFVNNKIDSINGFDLDEMIAACKTYTGATISPITDDNGITYNTVADIANSPNFEKIVNRACSYENLKKSIEFIREANAHRNLSIHNAGTLKVSYQLMGTAIISNSICIFQTGHNLTKGDTKWHFWESGNATTMSENLAYSGASSEMGWDPFHGWYYKERMRAVSNDRGVPDTETVAQSVIDEILQESEANGYPYDPYSYPWNQSQAYFQGRISDVTGHYESLISPEYKATGFSYIDGTENALTDYPYVAAQEFNNDTSTSLSVDAYEQELDSWFDEYLTALENALSEKESLETKPDYVTSAEAALQEKQNELQQAQQTVTEKTNALKDKNTELENVEAEIATLTDELSTAEQNKNTKENEKNTALEKLNAATAANTKAEALDADAPDTYKDDQELKDLVEACGNAQKKLSDAQEAVNTKQNDAKDAESLYEKAKAAYDQKKELYDAAVADYNSAKKAYNAAANISNSTITVANQTYSGKALTPAPKVVLNDKTLVNGTDYTVKYSANTNVGTATVTVTGEGDYIGSASKMFTIKARTITPAVTLSKTAFTYNGKVQTPAVTVKYGSKNLVNKTDYTVTYASGRKNVGTYAITVKLKGNYSGSKKVSYKINPKGTSISILSRAKKAFTVTWKRQSSKMASKYIGGYQVQYSLNKNFKTGNKTVGVAGYKKTSRKVSGLKVKTKYYVRVRTYMKVGKTTLYSPWSSVKAVTTPAAKKAKTSTSAAAAAAAAASAKGSTVYWTPNGSVYHVSKNCSTLSRSKTIHSGTKAQSGKPRACRVCGN